MLKPRLLGEATGRFSGYAERLRNSIESNQRFGQTHVAVGLIGRRLD